MPETSGNPAIIRKSLENDLMLAIREIELRLPDSGARECARQLAVRLTSTSPGPGPGTDYDVDFEVLDVLDKPLVMTVFQEYRQREGERKALADRLETDWPASPVAAYFYIATAVSAGQLASLKPQMDAILNTYPQNLAVRYRFQAYAPTFTGPAARDLLEAEPRFGEIHYLFGQSAVFDAALLPALRELRTPE